MLEFVKYHGLGNDFVLVDRLDARGTPPAWGSRARAWCDRRTGIGADGVLVLEADAQVDARLSIYNSDGSDGGMCGNGIRCVARHLFERRLRRGGVLRIRTGRGVVTVEPRIAGGAFVGATVDMGEPILEADRVPVRVDGESLGGRSTPWDGLVRVAIPGDVADAWKSWSGGSGGASGGEGAGLEPVIRCVSMGNPHAVLFCERPEAVPLEIAGPMLETYDLFPARTNVHFVRIDSTDSATMRTWERGAGATLACGTGACAVLVAAAIEGKLKREAAIRVPGGELQIRWEQHLGHVFMTGPATEVYRGTISIGEG
ncbi:MAG: diaminopimelate epimerase [Phycisphaerales bacterium]|nr:diaminopimelate epimerase [Phycisphaerales bacterium]